jgi:predicted DNA-binding transcriptional regulator YafY
MTTPRPGGETPPGLAPGRLLQTCAARPPSEAVTKAGFPCGTNQTESGSLKRKQQPVEDQRMPKQSKAKPKPQAAGGGSRPPLQRMMQIHQAIQSGSFPNATRLARELDVSTKSIHRDLDFMRDRFELPLAYDARRNGYHYTQEVTAFPAFQITEGELFALLVAEKALQQYRGTTFEKPLLSAFRKMQASLPDTISLNLAEWENTISFRTTAEPIVNLEIFDALARATANRKQLLLAYRKAGHRQTEPRVVDPYHLANINGEWFLFGQCHLRNDIRTFAPARIHEVSLTGKTFKRPHQFSLEKRLRDSFGVHSASGEFEVAIRFSEFAADYIREKKWHASQRLKECEGGGVELSMTLSSLPEVQRWILGWGGHAVAVHPPALVEMVRKAAQNILDQGPK